MRGRVAVVAEPDGSGRTRLTTLRSEPPITLRPTARALYVAASAGGPLGGDEVALDVTVAAGARLTLRTVAAAIALPGSGGTSALRIRLAVAGWLAVLPEPTIIADNAAHHTAITADIAESGALILREEAILGRHGERGGRYRGTVSVDVAGRPLLRSELTLDGADPTTGAIAARATGSLLFANHAVSDAGTGGDPSAEVAALRLAGPGLLVTALADDGRTLRCRLDRWLRTSG